MTIRPTVLVLALLASLAFAQAAAAQPITLHVTSARTVTNQPDPVELTGTISLAPNNSGSGTPVTGTGTLFTSELHVGDLIKPYTAPGAVPRWLVVASISSDTSLRLTQPGAGGGRYNGPAVSGVKLAALPAQVTISKGDPVTTFKYLVNQEDTDNNTQPASACQPSGPNDTLSSCLWTSIRHLSGSTNAAPGPYNPTTGFQGLVPDSSPVVTSGDQADFANGGTINLPPGKYMISFVADGHKIDGAHFTTDNSATTKVVNAQAQPYDLPLATLRVQVFNDNASTNGQWDEGDETYDPQLNRAARMPGFTAHLADIMGEVTTDWYGNPLCTTYRPTTAPGRTGYELDAEGHPIILNRGGQCVSNMAGEIVVPNMGPDRYAVTVLAPARTVVTPPGLQPTCRNKDWVKTTTLEGGPDWDTWIQDGRHRLRHRVPAFGRAHSVDAGRLRLPAQRAERQPEQRRHGHRPRDEGARLLPLAGRPSLQRHRRRRLRRHEARRPDQPAVGLAREPAGRRRRHGSRARQHRRHVHDPARPARRLHDLGLGRAAQRDHRQLQPDRSRPPDHEHRRRDARRLVRRDVRHGLQRPQRERPPGPGRARHPGLPGHRQDPQQLDRGSGIADLPDRHRRPLQPQPGVSAQPVQRARGLRRRLEDHRRHVPGGQPADADDRARRGRRRQLPADHRPLRSARLGRQALCGG